jgi:hypothetical protein
MCAGYTGVILCFGGHRAEVVIDRAACVVRPCWMLRLGLLTAVLAGCADEPDSWAAVRNPILGFEELAIKDAFLVEHAGTWHLGYSEISDQPFRFRLGFASSPDLREFETAPTLDQPETGGLASPNVVRAPDGRYVMTYNSHTRDVGATLNKLYYRTSLDLVTWSEPARFHIGGADGDQERLIDGALAFTETGVFLAFKREQQAHLAHAPSLDGPWTLVGRLEPTNLENCQFLQIDGVWHLLATTIPLLHAPALHRLDGDAQDPSAWLQWSLVRELEIPAQAWNDGPFLDHERANASYLVDRRASDGFFYLLYAGSTDLSSFEGRGHSSLGLARSVDLETWEAAPAR